MELICFDCDSTLSSIEGIDELARLRGQGTFDKIEGLTRDAMNGRVPVEAVFGLRLDIIKPTRSDAESIGRRYIETVEPTAKAALAALVSAGWFPLIISGGYRQCIRPFADYLGIGPVEAVDLFFKGDGSYRGFDEDYPATRSGGKPEIIRRLKSELSPSRVVMVGDGASDLETRPEVDLFIGFGRYIVREKVKQGAAAFAMSLAEVPALVASL